MADTEVQFEDPLASHAPSGQQEQVSGEREPDCTESLQNTGQGEVEEPLLSSSAVVAQAPPCGDGAACSCLGARWMERSLESMELQLQLLTSKADDLHNWVTSGQGHFEREALAEAVSRFLYTCQPYFNHLEYLRSHKSQHTLLPFDSYTWLLDFSQQLCDRLEQLVLTYASYNLLCLDETNPNSQIRSSFPLNIAVFLAHQHPTIFLVIQQLPASVSPFCMGQSQLGPLRVAAFRYFKPMPYLAQVHTSLYKRMRWNVDRLREEQSEEGVAKIVGDTEYYFLCYEDIPNAHADAGEDSVVRMWSIGKWVQVTPDTDDIYDWIICEVSQADYHRLLFLGRAEPSSGSATVRLQQMLSSHQTAE
ncbi:UPF0575 protein C19orf67 homolog isoform X2 [Cebidichthys violaceus]|uniref:UPF0575 protein C19orf67 homolog isoform X2 n=1 Tax=Cebidichthys violaceus TaxID=271503 RepID=UPI0035C9D91A